MVWVWLLTIGVAFVAGTALGHLRYSLGRATEAVDRGEPFVAIERTFRRVVDGHRSYYAELLFLEDVHDVVVTIESFRTADTGSATPFSLRWRLDLPFERESCPAGTEECVRLIELGDILSGSPDPQADEEWFKVCLRVAARDRTPFVSERYFQTSQSDLFLIPEGTTPDADVQKLKAAHG